jgi:MoaA/NifB/PqqE/SkfB family radical SAM enzyme
MCNVWNHPSHAAQEIGIDIVKKLPDMFFTNITGGEPFIRHDILEIVSILKKKTKRIVISTNGFFTERIIELCRKYPDTGIRISMEGLRDSNDKIRGMPGGYDRTQETFHKLRKIGIRDIGFAMTVQDLNYSDLVRLYSNAKEYGYEFATAAVHNSHYFQKHDNKIEQQKEVTAELLVLISRMLKSRKIKEWFRAYFNYGLINHIKGNQRLLPCAMGRDGFFVDPSGDVLACNGMDQKVPMGNLNENSWDEIWNSSRAREVRDMVKNCRKNCWMIGSAAPAIWHHPLKPIMWILENKCRILLGRKLRVD